jgi:hypothetical protein
VCTCLGVCLGFCLVSGLLPEHACICVGVWVVALDLTVSELLPGVWVGVCFVGSCCLGCGMWDLVAWCLRCGIWFLPCGILRYLVICGILLSATLAHWHTRCALLRAVHACSYMRARTCVLVHACSYMRACTARASMYLCSYVHACIHARMCACTHGVFYYVLLRHGCGH